MKVNTFTTIAVKLFQVTNCFPLSRITKMDRMNTGVDKMRKLSEELKEKAYQLQGRILKYAIEYHKNIKHVSVKLQMMYFH